MENVIYLPSDYQADLFSFENQSREYSPKSAKRTYTQNWSAYNQAQENEILCKVVCHNISVLILAVFELNLDIPYM
jgi:hypothetical protein